MHLIFYYFFYVIFYFWLLMVLFFSYYDIFHVTITDTNNTLYFSHHVNPCLISVNHLIVFETNRIIIVSRNQSTFACRSIHLVSPLPPSFRPLLTSCYGVPLRSWIVSSFGCQRSIVAVTTAKKDGKAGIQTFDPWRGGWANNPTRPRRPQIRDLHINL